MSLVLGTIEDVYVYNNKADDATKTYNPHCMWCEREFELSNSDDAICSMYETVDAGYQWTGEYIHRECDFILQWLALWSEKISQRIHLSIYRAVSWNKTLLLSSTIFMFLLGIK